MGRVRYRIPDPACYEIRLYGFQNMKLVRIPLPQWWYPPVIAGPFFKEGHSEPVPAAPLPGALHPDR